MKSLVVFILILVATSCATHPTPAPEAAAAGSEAFDVAKTETAQAESRPRQPANRHEVWYYQCQFSSDNSHNHSTVGRFKWHYVNPDLVAQAALDGNKANVIGSCPGWSRSSDLCSRTVGQDGRTAVPCNRLNLGFYVTAD